MKLNFETNIAEGTPKELVEYLRLVEEGEKNSGIVEDVEEETASTELQVGDKVKVLRSAGGAEGEATVTKVYEDGDVEIEGTSKDGIHLPNWSSHVNFLEKIEEEEEVEPEEVEEEEPTELKVGDKVKVLASLRGAEGEATVTKVLEGGNVLIAGTSKAGTYLPNWSNHVMNLEKIEEEDEDIDPEEADELLGYRYWYLATANFNKFVVLEASPEGYFEDSTGKRYTHQAVSGYVKPIDREDAHVKFDFAERKGALLSYYPTVDIFQISY